MRGSRILSQTHERSFFSFWFSPLGTALHSTYQLSEKMSSVADKESFY